MHHANRVGLALGGGGLWGLSHIGVADVLSREQVPINAIAGASMGAVIGGILSMHINEEGHISRRAIFDLLSVAEQVQTIDQLTEERDGKTLLALNRILSAAGPDVYTRLTQNNVQVPYFAQVSERTPAGVEQEIFLGAKRGETWDRLSMLMRASAALKPKFGMHPVEVDGHEYTDDTSVAYKSTNTTTRTLREAGASKVIGVPVGFVDTTGLGKATQSVLDFFMRSWRDRGDVVIEPKTGKGPFNGNNALTNFGKGWLGIWQKFARTGKDLEGGKRIAIPTEEFIEAGRKQAQAKMPEIDRMLGRK